MSRPEDRFLVEFKVPIDLVAVVAADSPTNAVKVAQSTYDQVAEFILTHLHFENENGHSLVDSFTLGVGTFSDAVKAGAVEVTYMDPDEEEEE